MREYLGGTPLPYKGVGNFEVAIKAGSRSDRESVFNHIDTVMFFKKDIYYGYK